MKLPDFNKWLVFYELREAMGITSIPVLPPVTFERTIRRRRVTTVVDEAAKRLTVELTQNQVPATIREIDVESQTDLLEYHGRKVAAYIRDQRQGIHMEHNLSDYRYHLTNCTTLQWMRDQGRETRYFVTRRTDGRFLVNDLSGHRRVSRELKLELCFYCRTLLRKKKLYFNPFNLKTYFERHNSDVPETITKEEIVEEVQTYTPDQKQISESYRERAEYTCQRCGVQCGRERKGLLHLHHVDGDPSNNSHGNLRVLCIACHALEPLHSHLGAPEQFKRDISEIIALQVEQRIRMP